MAPEDVRCVALTSQSLQVSWQPPPSHHTNGLLQGYKLNFEQVMDNLGLTNDDMDTRKTTALTIVLSNLRKFTNYSMQVLAFTRMGDGQLSASTFCQTEEDGKNTILKYNISFYQLIDRLHSQPPKHQPTSKS